jgi:hypothetical protein
MAIGAGTVTLADYALMSNQPLVQAVSMSLIDYGNILQDVQLTTKQSLQANGTRFEGNLPTVNWRALNAEGVSVHGQPTPYQEQCYFMTNYVDVDKYIVQDQNQIVDPRSTQTAIVLKALTYDLNFKYFKNAHDGTGDANAPVGLRARIDDAASANKFGVRPENKIDCLGAAADLSQAGLTAKTAGAFFEMLDLLLWSVDADNGSPGVVLYMNDYMRRRIHFALRFMGTSGGLDQTRDQFDRIIYTYKGAVIRDPGVKADQTTRIIAGNAIAAGSGSVGETAAGVDSTGASANFTSIYAVNHGTDHFFGWQFGPFNVQDLGLINNGVIYRTLIDWGVGFMNTSTRSIGRLYDIKIG